MMLPRSLLLKLLGGLVVLPIALVIVLVVGRLLAAMGDAQAAHWLDGIALFGGIVWVVDLVAVVLVLGLQALAPSDEVEEDI